MTIMEPLLDMSSGHAHAPRRRKCAAAERIADQVWDEMKALWDAQRVEAA